MSNRIDRLRMYHNGREFPRFSRRTRDDRLPREQPKKEADLIDRPPSNRWFTAAIIVNAPTAFIFGALANSSDRIFAHSTLAVAAAFIWMVCTFVVATWLDERSAR